MRLRMFIGGFGPGQLAGLVVDVMMALRRAVDPIGPVQPRIEPLRRIRRRHLPRQHVAHFVVIRLGVAFGIEIPALPGPIGPGARKPVEYLLCADFAAEPGLRRKTVQSCFIGNAAPQPCRDIGFLDPFQMRRHAGLAEIFLRQHIAGDLTPAGWDFDSILPEYGGSVRITDFADGFPEINSGKGGLSLDCESTLYTHEIKTPALFCFCDAARRTCSETIGEVLPTTVPRKREHH